MDAKLLAIRTELGWSLGHVAKITGISTAIISRIENRKVVNPGIFTVAKLAKVYGVSLDELAQEER